MKNEAIAITAYIILILWGYEAGADSLFILDMCVWIRMMISAYKRIERDFLLFAFGLTFFTFLMGREFLEQYSLYSVEKTFLPSANHHLSLCVLIALLSFWIAYNYFSRRRQTADDKKFTNQVVYNRTVRKYAKLFFFLSLPFALISTITVSWLVFQIGYEARYVDVTGLTASNSIVYICDKIGIMMSPSFCIFSATLPSKQEFYNVGKWFMLYSFLTIFEGARGTFLINILVFGAILAYIQCMRREEKWFEKRKYVRWAMVGVPLIMIASVAIKVGRSGDDWRKIDTTEALTDFLYQQGVTGLSVKRAYEIQSFIPKPVSGYYTLEFLHSGLPARLLGNKVYSGHNEEHALKGNSMIHALAYTVMGTSYFAGNGTGSSYIIETYYDFGYIGVALGSICYAFLFSLLLSSSTHNLFTKSLSLMIIGSILWSPRAAFTDFLQHLLAPTILFVTAFIFICAYNKRHVAAV